MRAEHRSHEGSSTEAGRQHARQCAALIAEDENCGEAGLDVELAPGVKFIKLSPAQTGFKTPVR